MAKLLMNDFSPAHTAWLRYASALASYLVAFAFLDFFLPERRKRLGRPFVLPKRPKDLGLLALLGFMTFCFAPFLQMTGLNISRATDNSVIIAMEPMITVFLAWLFLAEKVTSKHVFTFFVAIIGFLLLTEMGPSQLFQGWNQHLIGNLILLVSLTGEASYSVLCRKLMKRYSMTGIFGTALACGVLFLGILTLLVSGLPPLSHLSLTSLLALLWLGPLGTTVTYLYWMSALREAPVASLALTLFVQPVLGTIWGYLFLDDRLNLVQTLGACLILSAVFAQSYLETRSPRGLPGK